MLRSLVNRLRIHDTQEWNDIYQAENCRDLQSFFDHYLKGDTKNGWEKTPRIRSSLLGYNRPNIVNRPIAAYGPPLFNPTTFFLDADRGLLQPTSPERHAVVEYNAELRNDQKMEKLVGLRFVHTFSEYTELCGWSKATLYMSTKDSDDMDVNVVLRKLDKDGKALQSLNMPFGHLPNDTKPDDLPWENVFRYIGPNGRLRASHRAVAEEPGLNTEQKSQLSEAYVWHPHDKVEKLALGEIYKLDITLWPGGMIFEEGEAIALEVKGCYPIMPEFEVLLDRLDNYNVGSHCVHTGGAYPSSLLLPLSSIKA